MTGAEPQRNSRLMRLYTARCGVCGKPGRVDDVPLEGLAGWLDGTPVQDAFPEMAAPLREQITTGIHPRCYTRLPQRRLRGGRRR